MRGLCKTKLVPRMKMLALSKWTLVLCKQEVLGKQEVLDKQAKQALAKSELDKKTLNKSMC